MSYTIEHGGKKIVLPDFKEMPVGVVRKARNAEAEDAMWLILENILDEKQLAIIDTMPLSQFTDAMSKWTQGAALGESSQS